MADFGLVSHAAPSIPALPIEIWEHVIDLHVEFGYWLHFQDRWPDLLAWTLVCRAWVPRCRFYLYLDVRISSRISLEEKCKILWSSPFHARRVTRLEISGVGSDQSWISTVPLRLPKLSSLEELIFNGVDFTQQHPSFPQHVGLLKRRAESGTSLSLDLKYADEDINRQAMQIAVLAGVLRLTSVNILKPLEGIHTAADVAALNSWPRRLTSLMSFLVEGDLEDLGGRLSAWQFPAGRCEIRISHSSLPKTIADITPEARVVWKSIHRILGLSITALIAVCIGSTSEFPVFIVKKLPGQPLLVIIYRQESANSVPYLSLLLRLLVRRSFAKLDVEVDPCDHIDGPKEWTGIDDALHRSSLSEVRIMCSPQLQIPMTATLPFTCINEVMRTFLPKCVAAGKIRFTCMAQNCKIHTHTADINKKNAERHARGMYYSWEKKPDINDDIKIEGVKDEIKSCDHTDDDKEQATENDLN